MVEAQPVLTSSLQGLFERGLVRIGVEGGLVLGQAGRGEVLPIIRGRAKKGEEVKIFPLC